MTEVSERQISRIVEIIVDAAEPEKIILFGSRASGAHQEGSDIDLLIVDSEPFNERRSRRKELARLWRLLASVPVAKDLLLYSRDEMDYWKDSLNHVVGRALREGKVLYERS
ncbi:MAG: nucleotidyltransferase domain-containing protein [Desulfomonilaceae bacterium]|nr:nucleotidyltransferase domain-containing protein [Desulfomonilaceae bacterium]